MKWFWKGLPHVTIVVSLMTLTFFAIDRVNRSMAFMTSEMSKWLFAGLALCSLLCSLALIACHWREDAREARHELRMQAKQKELAEKLFANHEYMEEPQLPREENPPETETEARPESPEEAGEEPENPDPGQGKDPEAENGEPEEGKQP